MLIITLLFIIMYALILSSMLSTKAYAHEYMEIPPAPMHLHTMAVESNLVDLMWGLVQNAVRYDVYRSDGQHEMRAIGSSVNDTFTDRTIQPGRQYYYHVIAFDHLGRRSKPSNTITVNIPIGITPPAVQILFAPSSSPVTNWDAFAKYNVGDIVLYHGQPFQALISFKGYGDPYWSPSMAPSVWSP